LNKVGKAGGEIPVQGPGGPHAEEITPFVMAGGQSSPYRDHHAPYNDGSYSSAASETAYGPSLHPRPSTHSFAASRMPADVVSPPHSQGTFDPYSGYAEPPTGSEPRLANPYNPNTEYGSSSGPSNYSTSAPQTMAGASGSGLVAGSVPMAGPSASTSHFAIANPGAKEEQDVKQGPAPPAARQESIYQHEDISDVVELPPAYKERD